MRKRLNILIFSLSFLTSLQAQEPTQDNYALPPPVMQSNEEEGLRLSLGTYQSGRCRFVTSEVDTQSLSFSDASIKLSNSSFSYNQEDKYFLSGELEHTKISWEQNPVTKQKSFTDLILGAGMTTNTIEDWALKFMIDASLDLRKPSITKTSKYKGLALGIFHYDPELRFHLGALVAAQIRKYVLLPVVGVSYQNLYSGLTMKLVFPMKASVSYELSPEWIISLRHRLKAYRHRAKAIGSSERIIFDYKAHGVEAALKYKPMPFTQLVGFVGYHAKPTYRTMNKDGKNKRFYQSKSGAYFGFDGYLVF